MNGAQRTQHDQQDRLARELRVRHDDRLMRQEIHENGRGRYLLRSYQSGRRAWVDVYRVTGGDHLELLTDDQVPACVALRARAIRGRDIGHYIGSGG